MLYSKNFNFAVEIMESEKEKLFAYRLNFFLMDNLKTQVSLSKNHSASDSLRIV